MKNVNPIRVALTFLLTSAAMSVRIVTAAPGDRPTAMLAAATQPAVDQRVLNLPAIIAPDERVDLYAKLSGYISKVNVDIGSRVHRGDVLIELDIPEMQDELRQAEATLAAKGSKVQALQAKTQQARLMIESAQAEEKRSRAEHNLAKITFDRKSELFQGKAIPAQEFDVAQNALTLTEAQVAIARAKVAAAQGDAQAAQADAKAGEADAAVAKADLARVKTLLGYTTIKAPFDGVITRRNVDPGAFVRSAAQSASTPLLTIDKLDRVRLVVDIPEADAALVQPGTVTQVVVRSMGEKTLTLSVTRTAVAVRTESRTMRAEIDIENSEVRFLPGMYARVTIPLMPVPTTRPGV